MMNSAKRESFDQLAPRWDSIPLPPDAEARVAEFCSRALPPGPRRVLDVGSGTGLLLPFLQRQCGGALIVELDFSPAMLRTSREKHSDRAAAHVCADALCLPFPDSTFDAVLCFGILPHLGPVRPALEALWRAVAPGGRLAVGHLLGSVQLNERHREIGGPVGGDVLVPGEELAGMLRAMGAVALEVVDRPDRYRLVVQRSGR